MRSAAFKKKPSFQKTLLSRYEIRAEDGPNNSNNHPGSAKPEINWQAHMQTGENPEDIRKKAVQLSKMVQAWQSDSLEAAHIFETLDANGGKWWEMFLPILLQNISREKLTTLITICQKLAVATPVK